MTAGGHFNKACADGPFPKTSLYVNGLVIASSFYFNVFKVDALSRGSVMSQILPYDKRLWRTRRVLKTLEGSSFPKNLIPM